MSHATARRDIENRLSENWILTDVAYANVPFISKSDASWVEVGIFEDDTRRINIGNPGIHRTTGLIIVKMHHPKGSGTQTARDYADQMALIYRDQQFGGITCQEASIKPVPDNEWYTINVSIKFYWDGTYTV